MRRKRHWIPSGVLRAHNKRTTRQRLELRRSLVYLAGHHRQGGCGALLIHMSMALGVRVPRSLRVARLDVGALLGM